VAITNTTLASVAITAAYSDGSTYPVACFIAYPDGRHHLEFYIGQVYVILFLYNFIKLNFKQAMWALYSVILGNIWLDWVDL
jgi:hypothetical protein